MMNRKGQSLIELALVLPLILAISTGGLVIGNSVTTKHRFEQAAYEGTKIISQADRSGCAAGAEACFKSAMVTRAERVLSEAGMDVKGLPGGDGKLGTGITVEFSQYECKDTTDATALKLHKFVELEILPNEKGTGDASGLKLKSHYETVTLGGEVVAECPTLTKTTI